METPSNPPRRSRFQAFTMKPFWLWGLICMGLGLVVGLCTPVSLDMALNPGMKPLWVQAMEWTRDSLGVAATICAVLQLVAWGGQISNRGGTPGRRWYQFSLRSILESMFWFAVGVMTIKLSYEVTNDFLGVLVLLLLPGAPLGGAVGALIDKRIVCVIIGFFLWPAALLALGSIWIFILMALK